MSEQVTSPGHPGVPPTTPTPAPAQVSGDERGASRGSSGREGTFVQAPLPTYAKQLPPGDPARAVPEADAPPSGNSLKAISTRAASSTHPSAPLPPHVDAARRRDYGKLADDKDAKAPDAKTGEVLNTEGDHTDGRLLVGHDLAMRGLSYMNVNDLAKSVLILFDLLMNEAPGDSKIAQDIAAGKEPSLLP